MPEGDSYLPELTQSQPKAFFISNALSFYVGYNVGTCLGDFAEVQRHEYLDVNFLC